jgi:Flp pilus assembly protein TadG
VGAPDFVWLLRERRFSDMNFRLSDVGKDQTGSGLVEFTLVLPVLLFLMLGIAQFGLIFYNYLSVTNAAAYGARIFAIGHGDTTIYADATSAINNAAPRVSGLTITLSVDGTACTTNSSCQTALLNAHQANVANTAPTSTKPLQGASVTASYACTANLIPAYLINLTGICPLTSTMQQVVE